jgi:hypothetical protein
VPRPDRGRFSTFLRIDEAQVVGRGRLPTELAQQRRHLPAMVRARHPAGGPQPAQVPELAVAAGLGAPAEVIALCPSAVPESAATEKKDH